MSRRTQSATVRTDHKNAETIALGQKLSEIRTSRHKVERRWTMRDFHKYGIYSETMSALENGTCLVTNAMRTSVFDRITELLRLDAAFFEPELSHAIRACTKEPATVGSEVPDVDADLELLFVDYHYSVGPQRLACQWESVHVYRPLNKPMTSIRHYYIYTGEEGTDILEIRRGGVQVGPRAKSINGFTYYDIELSRTVQPGETHLVDEIVRFHGATLAPLPFTTGSVPDSIEICQEMVIRALSLIRTVFLHTSI
jgi:hypothetical protein